MASIYMLSNVRSFFHPLRFQPREMLKFFVSLFLVVNADKFTEEDKFVSWANKFLNWKTFRQIPSDFTDLKLDGGGPKIVNPAELADYKLEEKGEFVVFRRDDDDEGDFCFRGKCKETFSEVITRGKNPRLLNGPTLLRNDNRVLYRVLRNSTAHGVGVDLSADGRRWSKIAVFDDGVVRSDLFAVQVMDLKPFFTAFRITQGDEKRYLIEGRFSSVFRGWKGEFWRTSLDDIAFEGAWPRIRPFQVDREKTSMTFKWFEKENDDELLALAETTFLYLRSRPPLLPLFPLKKDAEEAVEIVKASSNSVEQLEDDVFCQLAARVPNKGDWPRVRMISLVAQPGSGAKWLNAMLGTTSGHSRKAVEFVVEHLRSEIGTTLFVQNHHQSMKRYRQPFEQEAPMRQGEVPRWRMLDIASFGGRGIVLIRNPYRAIVSYWNHIRAKHVAKANPALEEEVRTSRFSDFARNEARLWFEVAAEWIVLGSRVAVVHYEDLLKDDAVLRSEIKRLLEYFDIPYDESRLRCLNGKPAKFNGIKRPKSNFELTADHFREDVRATIDSYAQRLSLLLRQFGHKDLPMDKYDL